MKPSRGQNQNKTKSFFFVSLIWKEKWKWKSSSRWWGGQSHTESYVSNSGQAQFAVPTRYQRTTTIDSILNGMINGMYHLSCFALLVAVAKIHFGEQALVPGANESNRADKTGRPSRQSGLPALFMPACFVLSLLLMLTFPSGFCTN